MADIHGDGLDFGAGIGRAYGAAHARHDLVVGDIVAHIEHLLILQVVLGLQQLVGLHLHGTGEEDVLDA